MNDWFLEPYLKLNLLLAVAYALWLLTKFCARLGRFEVGQARQLAIARALFLGFLLAAPLLWLLDNFVPLFAALAGWAPGGFLAGEMSVSAYMDQGLGKEYQLAGRSMPLAAALSAFLLAGFAVQALRFAGQWRHLRRIVGDSLEIRAFRGISILVSEDVATPFSTRALGRNHIVLPARLLESPRNFRIARKHELQHLRNGDLDWVISIEALKLLCFWNPAAHAWHHEFDALQEFACDEVLVGRRRLAPRNYGDCLLAVAATSSRDILPASSNMAPRFSLLGTSQSQLRRRIVMMNRVQEWKFSGLKTSAYVMMFSGALLTSSLFVFAQPEQEERSGYFPVSTIAPQYPRVALEQRLEGWAVVEFTVMEDGSVRSPFVVNSCAEGEVEGERDENGCLVDYQDVFNESSLRAVERFTFEPRQAAGAAVQTPGVQYVFRYRLSSDERGSRGQAAG